MTIPPKVILIWAGTNASIPTGFTRVTVLDTQFAKGCDVGNQNVTGGSDSHSHTSPAHSHAVQAHNHTFDLSTVGSDTDDCGGSTSNGIITGSHQHNGNNTDSTSASFSSSDSITYGSQTGNSLPPYYSVIFIKSNGYPTPTNVIALFANTTLPSGWNECNGLSSTPDLRNKYLRGASTGNDAGATGGSYTHSHVLDHSHTNGAMHTHHAYSTTLSGGLDNSNGGSVDVAMAHQHNFNTDAAEATITAYTGTQSLSDTVEPLFKKLRAIQKNSSPDSSPVGLIGLFLDNPLYIPAGWAVCDGTNGTPDMRGYHLKIANDGTEIGTTGGSNTHTHAATSHSHGAGASHNHTGTTDGHIHQRGIDGVGSDHTDRSTGKPHSMINVQQVTPLHDSATTTADASNNEPAYTTAIFIQFQKFIGGAVLESIM